MRVRVLAACLYVCTDAMQMELSDVKEATSKKLAAMEATTQSAYDECDKLRNKLKDEMKSKVYVNG